MHNQQAVGEEGTQSWVIEENDGPQLHWHLLVLPPNSRTAIHRVQVMKVSYIIIFFLFFSFLIVGSSG